MESEDKYYEILEDPRSSHPDDKTSSKRFFVCCAAAYALLFGTIAFCDVTAKRIVRNNVVESVFPCDALTEEELEEPLGEDDDRCESFFRFDCHEYRPKSCKTRRLLLSKILPPPEADPTESVYSTDVVAKALNDVERRRRDSW